jgi:hypothetical protein
MSVWNFGLQRMMDLAGQQCRITIENEPIYFQGILDQTSQLVQDDRGIEWIENMFRLTVRREIATRIPKDKQNTIQIDDQTYTIRHILLTGDGENCELYLTKLNAFNNECDPPGSC